MLVIPDGNIFWKNDLRIALGEQFRTREMETDESMKEQAKGCFALLPLGNLEGLEKLLYLTSLEVIPCSIWVLLPVTQETVTNVN